MNQFTLSFNPFSAKIMHSQVMAFITHNRFNQTWYSPFTGTIIFKTHLDLQSVTNSLRALFAGEAFIVSQTYPISTGGAQDAHIWNWMASGAVPSLAAPGN